MTNQNWIIELKAEAAKLGVELTDREIYLATPLKLNVTTNPKRKNSMAWTRFQGYFGERIVSIGDAFAAGLRQDDIRHDAAKGFILLGDAANAAYEAEEPAAPLLLTYDPLPLAA